MDAFKRVLGYVWPQWHRIAVIITSVLLIGILFSASFMTIIPLLKVMLGQEGIHGWVDRKVSSIRYGVDFYVPDRIDLADPDKGLIFNLEVTKVKSKQAALNAGLIEGAKIYYVGEEAPVEPARMNKFEMLQKLSLADRSKPLYVLYTLPADKALDATSQSPAVPKLNLAELDTTHQPVYVDWIHSTMSHISRVETKETKSQAVKIIIILMIFATIARCIARFLQDYLCEKVVRVAVSNIREETFDHILMMPMGHFSDEGCGDTVSRLIRDTDSAGRGIKTVLGKAIREPVKAISTLAAALWLNWQIVLIFMCGLPLIVAAVNTLGKRIKKATKKSLQGWSKMLSKLEETLIGLSMVKIYNRQMHESTIFKAINRSVLRQNLKISKVDSATGPVMEVIGMLAGSAGLLFALRWVFSGSLDSEGFFTLLVLIGTSAESMRKTSDVWNKIQESNAAAERVFALLDSKIEKEAPDAKNLATANKTIEFRNVVFSYPKSTSPVLKGIDLKVNAGQSIAVVGPNGSGKSTLLNLLTRFYDPDSGQVLIDGTDIKDVTLSSLRNHIALVTQKVITFNDTIAANIAYSKPDASREEVIAASKRAYAHEFIEAIPGGYDALIGEHGAGLSGGQLQRIVIARAILKNPDILIFDEAMSQVDADSESKINKALEEITHNRTSFVIAHRFSTVVNSDLIVVLNQGQVVATGTHHELIKDCQIYKNLYETQLL